MAYLDYTTRPAPPTALSDETLARALGEIAFIVRRELKPKAAKRILASLNAHADRLDHCGRADRVVSIREPRPHSGVMSDRYARAAIVRHLVSEVF